MSNPKNVTTTSQNIQSQPQRNQNSSSMNNSSMSNSRQPNTREHFNNNNRDLICEPSSTYNAARKNSSGSNSGGGGGKTVILRNTDFVSTGTSPEHTFYDDVPLTKLKPKTRIVYDTGTPEMCTQGN